MTPILRPHAVCDAREPICPHVGQSGCAHVLMGRTTFRPDGSITTCLHRERGETCGLAAAPDCEPLRYFAWHWAAGLTEVYAEAFALLTVGVPEWGEAEFRAAFPRCIDLVRRDLDALIEDEAVAA